MFEYGDLFYYTIILYSLPPYSSYKRNKLKVFKKLLTNFQINVKILITINKGATQ